MTTIGSPKRFLLLAAIAASLIVALTGCNSESGDGDTDGASQSTNTDANGAGSGGEAPAVESEALATVLSFQQAVLDLDLESAQELVDETTAAYESVSTAITTLRNATENPNLPDEARQLVLGAITGAWRGATTEIVIEEGSSAIISVTRANGESIDVNLNLFDGKWLINGPDNIVELR